MAILGLQQEMTLSSLLASIEDAAYGLVEFDFSAAGTPPNPNGNMYWNEDLFRPFHEIYKFIDMNEKFPVELIASLALGDLSEGIIRAQNRRNVQLVARPENDTSPPTATFSLRDFQHIDLRLPIEKQSLLSLWRGPNPEHVRRGVCPP